MSYFEALKNYDNSINANRITDITDYTLETTLLNAVTSTSTSISVDVSQYFNKSIVLEGTLAALNTFTISVDASVDGVVWQNIYSIILDSTTYYDIFSTSDTHKYIRVVGTLSGTGTLSCYLLAQGK